MFRKQISRRVSGIASSGFLLVVSITAQAAPIDIFEFSVFMNATEFGSASVGETQIAYGSAGLSQFSGVGLDFSHMNSLDADNAGTLSWNITNNTGMDLSNARLFGFLDASIDEPVNTYFNETGGLANFIAGSGSVDSQADSWEIDEPGYMFGDIYNNILAGALDNSNGVVVSEDVSLALGFKIGDLLIGEMVSVVFDISLTDNGGLLHYDPDSQAGFYYNGIISRVNVSEPSIFVLLIFGLLTIIKQDMRRRAEIL